MCSAPTTEARHTRLVRAHTYARRREYARANERAAGTRGWKEVREEGNIAGSVRRLGWLAKGRFLDPERRDRRPRERARETGRGNERGYARKFVRSFAWYRLRKTRKWRKRESTTPFSLSLPLDLYSPSLDGLRRRKKVKDRFSGRRGS